VPPLEWVRRQTSGKIAEVLVGGLGLNYLSKLRVLAGSAKTVPKATLVEVAQRLRAESTSQPVRWLHVL